MKKNKVSHIFLVLLLLLIPAIVSADKHQLSSMYMADTEGNSITNSRFSGIAPAQPVSGAESNMLGAVFPESNLARQDYIDLYINAANLLTEGQQFRFCDLQLRGDLDFCTDTSDDPTEALQSYYANFNNDNLLNQFCPQFVLDERGYCTGDANSKRNQILKARRNFTQLYLVENQSMTFEIDQGSGLRSKNIRDIGLAGMLETTRELAYAHMIFGSEYAIDAFGYSFSLLGQAGSTACEAAVGDYQNNLGSAFSDDNTYFTQKYWEDADCIIQREINLLNESRKQYQFAIDIMTSAYHEDLSWPKDVLIGEIFGVEEIQIFAAVVENYAIVTDELAIRYRQLGGDTNEAMARDLYIQNYDELFLVTIPLLERGRELYQIEQVRADDPDNYPNSEINLARLESSGLAVRTGVEKLKVRLADMENGIDLYGFTPDYVPVQSYWHMRDAANGLLDWATEVHDGPDGALAANREFELNGDRLRDEMRNIRISYQAELVDLCGLPDGQGEVSLDYDFVECIGGAGSLMEQSWLRMASATIGINLADQHIAFAYQRILDIDSETNAKIEAKTQTGQVIEATNLALGMARAYQVTNSTSSGTSTETFEETTKTSQTITKPGLLGNKIPSSLSIEDLGSDVVGGVRIGEEVSTLAGIGGAALNVLSVSQKFGDITAGLGGIGGAATAVMNGLFGSTERSLIEQQTVGRRTSETKTTAVNSVFNPSEIEIAELSNVRDMAQFAESIQILDIERGSAIKELVREIARRQLEKELAVQQYNLAQSEHNALVNQWLYTKAQYDLAKADLGASYIANPAFRLLRDSKTEKASYHLLYAAKQSYLTAKALAYHLGVDAKDIPNINNVFQVRHPSHLRAYLLELEELNRLRNYEAGVDRIFSLRVIASGIPDEQIQNASGAEKQALDILRQERFKRYLDEHTITDDNGVPQKLVLVFGTSLDEAPINSPTIFNWRIAGARKGATDTDVDRCTYRNPVNPYGVGVDILPGAQPIPPDMIIRLARSGQSSIRQLNGQVVHSSPELVTILPDESIPDSVLATLSSNLADTSIAVNDAENTVSDFCNMSVANSNWILEIDLSLYPSVDYSLFQDIKIRMQTFYYG